MEEGVFERIALAKLPAQQDARIVVVAQPLQGSVFVVVHQLLFVFVRLDYLIIAVQ